MNKDESNLSAKKCLGLNPSVSADADICACCRLGAWVEIGERTKLVETAMGDYSYICNDGDVIYTSIGKFCSIASHVRINPGNHPMDRAALHHFTYRSDIFNLGAEDVDFFDWRRESHVVIGNDVWIGHGATIMPGVSIGDGAAIGSGAVVTKNVEPFSIIVGVPGVAKRKRFDEKTIAGLLKLKWWDWSHPILKERLGDFRKLSASQFVEKYI